MRKRLFDILIAAAGLLLLAPLMAIVAWQIRRRLGSPVLFRQWRPGRNGIPFEIIKFRTMRDALDAHGEPLPDGERMTPFGSFLRASSLDELPELWNVLKGDMSLVGPRPCMVRQRSLYGAQWPHYCQMRPGITGLWQVSGRNRLTYAERVQLDARYATEWSLWLDVKILARTVGVVLSGHGSS